MSKKNKTKKFLHQHIPILSWMRSYTREAALSDLIAGITIGLTIIPQSIAYAALASLSPQIGLNSAFMGCFIYIFFGGIKEVVIGPSSLMALLTYEYTHNLNTDCVVLLCFLCGIVELLMGILRLGFLVEFISAPVVSGFTTATSFIIIVSQAKGLMGLKFKSKGFVDNIKKLVDNIHEIRKGDFILGGICIISLLTLRKLKDIKLPKDFPYKLYLEKMFWLLSIGRNALIVVATALVTWYYEHSGLETPFITTSESAGTGIPQMSLPPTSTVMGNQTYTLPQMVSQLGTGYIVIPIVSVLANVAIAKSFVTGRVDATQEMLALSLCNIFGSCFQSMPTCGAFTRSAVISASGVRTPLACLYSACMTLMALGFLGSYFHFIPRATLAAVLIAAVLFLIDYNIFRPLWKSKNWVDLLTVLSTLFFCLYLGVEMGLLCGLLLGLLNLLFQWARPELTVLKQKDSDEEFILIIPKAGMFFPAVDFLSSQIIKVGLQNESESILVDCSAFVGSDYTVGKSFKHLAESFDKRGQRLKFINIPENCYSIWISGGCKEKYFSKKADVEYCLGDNEKDHTLSSKLRTYSTEIVNECEVNELIENNVNQNRVN